MLLQIAAFLAATVYGAEIAKPKPRLTAPDVSLRTLPLAYFGGNSASRSATNLQMLAKMRIVVSHCNLQAPASMLWLVGLLRRRYNRPVRHVGRVRLRVHC